MSEDIVHQLRREIPSRGDISLQQLAAAEIENQRAEIKRLQSLADDMGQTNIMDQIEIERLKEMLALENGLNNERYHEIERLKHTQMTADHVTISQAAALQAQRADALERKCIQLAATLHRSMGLIDQLISENARLGAATAEPPPIQLFAAKHALDAAMKELLSAD